MSKKIFIVAVPDEVNTQTEILGCNVIFGGVGKINATMAAYNAFVQGYDEVINIGSCGSVNIPVGEVVKVGNVYQDIDVTPLCVYGETPFEAAGRNKQVVIDIKSSISCFTTDYFYDEYQREKYSKNYLDMIKKCSIFDMECFALAKVCHKFNIRFHSYKWISDGGSGSDWKENCKIGFKKTLEIISDELFKEKRI
jgi:adenosylhomocysteine nucleosidase